MRNVRLIFRAGCLLAAACLWNGCGQPAGPPPVTQANASPTPAPSAAENFLDGKDLGADKLRDKANQAANSLGKYLDGQDPRMREKFQHLTDKITAQLAKDKGRWREKLQAERTRLQPQIEQLRQRLSQSGGATRDKLRDQLSELEKQSDTTDQKLSKLETMGADAWKQFKRQLKADAARDKSPPVDDPDATPAPTPAEE